MFMNMKIWQLLLYVNVKRVSLLFELQGELRFSANYYYYYYQQQQWTKPGCNQTKTLLFVQYLDHIQVLLLFKHYAFPLNNKCKCKWKEVIKLFNVVVGDIRYKYATKCDTKHKPTANEYLNEIFAGFIYGANRTDKTLDIMARLSKWSSESFDFATKLLDNPEHW